MSVLLDFLYLIVLVSASPWILYRLLVTRDGSSLTMRFGAGPVPASRCIWLHGSSVGEIALLKSLVPRFEQDFPGLPLVISAYTSTGLAAARAAYGATRVMPFPIDLSFVVRRRLAQLKPELVVIVESELWPNFLGALRAQGIPAALLNGKISARSYAFHRRTRVVPRVLSGLSLLAVQTEEHADRFRALGAAAARVQVTGNMKYDLTPPRMDAARVRDLRRSLGFADDAVVIIGGSLHEGEDAALLDAYGALQQRFKNTALIIVPRYPSEVGSVAIHIEQAGYQPVLRTAVAGGMRGSREVLLVDTVGELGQLYASANVAFVGGSLFFRGSNKGGHNLMEPAIFGLPVLFGPYNFSFKETVAALLAADGGMLVHDAAELRAALIKLVDNHDLRESMGEQARNVVLDAQGASERNYQLIQRLLAGDSLQLQPSAQASTMPPASSDPGSL